MSEPEMVKVLIVAADPLVRAGLATNLEDQDGCLVAGQIDHSDDLSVEMEVYRPDVILWDLGWEPAQSGLQRLLDQDEFADLIVALLPDQTHASAILNAGIRGLLLRQADSTQLWAALQSVATGLTVIDSALIDAIRSASFSGLLPELPEPLTPRELEVLQLLAEGLPNKRIARQLEISEHTVKFHINAILGKLNVHSRTEAVVQATRLGLVIL